MGAILIPSVILLRMLKQLQRLKLSSLYKWRILVY